MPYACARTRVVMIAYAHAHMREKNRNFPSPFTFDENSFFFHRKRVKECFS